LTGYQEVLTDPSYKGQIVTMTYPLIGNYGINEEDSESARPQVEGYGIVGIEGIDTRALTKHIRDAGAQQGIISTLDFDSKSLAEKIEKAPKLVGRDLVREVTCAAPYIWAEGSRFAREDVPKHPATFQARFKVVVYDFGVKRNILRNLVDQGCEVTVVPASTSAEEIMRLQPHGICLSNGPGDPEGVPYVIENVKELLGKRPTIGICLGHQILALAMGGKTYKLKFGHRGGNQPVKDFSTDKVSITAQNHGFCVDSKSLDPEEISVTHINLNDETVEGLRHNHLPIFSIQYHPEASPGPHDASYLFRQFRRMMEQNNAEKN